MIILPEGRWVALLVGPDMKARGIVLKTEAGYTEVNLNREQLQQLALAINGALPPKPEAA